MLARIYLVEYGRGWLPVDVTFMVDILTGVPSIVAALFIYAVFFIKFGAQFAGVYASLALVLLMIPVIVRTTEEMLKLVPNELREASYALGVPKWKTIVRIVLPTALSGIITGIVLGIARVAGETAPLLILVQYSAEHQRQPVQRRSRRRCRADRSKTRSRTWAPASKRSPGSEGRHNYAADRMWGAALTLIIIVMAAEPDRPAHRPAFSKVNQ